MPVTSSDFGKIGVELCFSSRKIHIEAFGYEKCFVNGFHCKYLSQTHPNMSMFSDMQMLRKVSIIVQKLHIKVIL